jgi:KDO2-lipid IV(A) lauroyltransferase
VSRVLARGLGRVVARTSSGQRTVVERNLRRIHGPGYPPELIRRETDHVFESYARYWLDTLRLPSLTPAQVEAGFTHVGMDRVASALEAGTPPILALPHVGGWEWAGRWLVHVRGWPVAAVAEQLEPPELYDWFLDLRNRLGMSIIPLGPSAASGVSAALASGSIVCLLADRDISGAGIEVEFFGETTRLPGGPALMALRSGSPLLPTAVYFEGDRCHAVVDPPLDTTRRGKLREDVTRVTQDLARAMEAQIRRAPDQWHLLQPNWPSDEP